MMCCRYQEGLSPKNRGTKRGASWQTSPPRAGRRAGVIAQNWHPQGWAGGGTASSAAPLPTSPAVVRWAGPGARVCLCSRLFSAPRPARFPEACGSAAAWPRGRSAAQSSRSLARWQALPPCKHLPVSRAGGCPALTFVVVPDADLPDAAQAALGGDLEDVEAVAVERVLPVQVPVAALVVRAVQRDPHVGRRAWWEAVGSSVTGGPVHCRVRPAPPARDRTKRPVEGPRDGSQAMSVPLYSASPRPPHTHRQCYAQLGKGSRWTGVRVFFPDGMGWDLPFSLAGTLPG